MLQFLQAEINPGEENSYLRLLLHNKVKYLTIEPGIYDPEDILLGPAIIYLLPAFPPGDWNNARIALNPTDGSPHLKDAVKLDHTGVENVWHPTKVDHLSLTYDRHMLASGVYKATHPDFPNSTLIAKFAVWPWEIGYRELEGNAYQWIEGQNIGPKFLGHIVEEGRVIGFILEHIDNARHASPSVEDLKACREKLSRLHRLGVLHRDVNKHNFLITADADDGEVRIIDFETAVKCEDSVKFEKEAMSLVELFNDTSGRGQPYMVVPAEEAGN